MMTDSHDTSQSGGLEAAERRLDQALSRVESRFETLLQTGPAQEMQEGGAELRGAAAAASEAMGEAIAELKDAIRQAEAAASDG